MEKICVRDGVIIDDEILYNAEKVQETSELMSILAQIRWKKEEIKEAKKDGRESLFLELKLDELYRQKMIITDAKTKKSNKRGLLIKIMIYNFKKYANAYAKAML